MRTTAFAIAATAAGAYALPQFQQSHVDNASQTIINDLKSHKLNRLASLLTSNMDVAEQITASPGEKLFLAPDNDAVAALPQYVLGHQGQLRATLLQHGTFGFFTLLTPETDQTSRFAQFSTVHSRSTKSPMPLNTL